MNINFWNPSRLYLSQKDEFNAEIQRVLTNGDLILRDDVKKFEKNLAEYLGVNYVIGVASGTDALMLAMKAFDIGAGDEVITTGYTFRATIEAIHHTGAKPVVIDIGSDWTEGITKKTKALIPAHIAGKILPWDTTFYNIPLIADACQAIGAPVKGQAACYSFYPAKILGSFGDGGAIATNDPKLNFKLRKMRNHYKNYWEEGYGYNSRLDNLQAAVLNVKLKYLPDAIKRRKKIAMKYDKIFHQEPRKIYQDYIVELPSVKERDRLFAYLSLHDIETIKNEYPFPDKTPKPLGVKDYESRTLRLPCNETITNEEAEYVIDKLKKYYAGK